MKSCVLNEQKLISDVLSGWSMHPKGRARVIAKLLLLGECPSEDECWAVLGWMFEWACVWVCRKNVMVDEIAGFGGLNFFFP